jgi:glutamate synthase domain-containing protein 3
MPKLFPPPPSESNKENVSVSIPIDCRGKSTREINSLLRQAIAEGQEHIDIWEPDARHNLAVALTPPSPPQSGGGRGKLRVVFAGSVGYYCGGMMDGATIEVRGSAGWGAAESMLNGTMIIDGNAGSGVAASIRGGTVVVRGNAAARAGVSMKGGTLLIGGNCGYMAGFMMQKGRIVICGDAGDALADSMYEGIVFVGGQIASLGNDAVIEQPTAEDRAWLNEMLVTYRVPGPTAFRKVISGRKLWNFDRRELEVWKAAL